MSSVMDVRIWGAHKSKILTVSSEDLRFTRGDEVVA